jgi:hypothetical protein
MEGVEVMAKRAITASTAALAAVLVVAAPAFADTDHVLFQPSIDWRLVVVFTVIGLVVFGVALRGTSRGR